MNSLEIKIINSSSEPFYKQIHDQIRDAILSGQLPYGQALPSIRFLAMELEVSVITTKRAYDDLESEGLIDTVIGRGSFVKEESSAVLEKKLEEELDQTLRSAAHTAVRLGIGEDEICQKLKKIMKEKA
ncbi:MAG: GntR family transcriptional regulator [Sphaerochaetaceae bacterium]|jgi:GntR family transcriptional regulator|nr:GntR family transcriptional regulator [Sphaerochaetaceae bacterium]MDD3162435.1 GntR family transcriptional regulator [Sphaerochaetaceae bacterium]